MSAEGLVESILEAFPGARIETLTALKSRIAFPPECVLVLSLSDAFPAEPPMVRIEWGDGSSSTIGMDWNPAAAASTQLLAALVPIIQGDGPYRIAWGSDASHPLSDDPNRARQAGWSRLITSLPTRPGLPAVVGSRIEQDTAAVLARSSVLIVGLGSVGSYLAEQFARMGVGEIAGVDLDVVEVHNLTRMPLSMEDVGRSKTSGITRKLTRLRPDLTLNLIEGDITLLDGEKLRPLFEGADLIVAATDQPAAQSRINALAYGAERPAVFASLYRGAMGGEIVFTVPGLTPCYECATGGRRNLLPSELVEAARDPTNYGRLAGEPALVADIHHVSSAALRIAVSLLAASHSPTTASAAFITQALGRGHCMVMFGMEPGYGIFPVLLRGVGGQFAFQSIWLNAQPQEDCAVCAPGRELIDPFTLREFVMSAPERERLQSLRLDD